MIWESSFWKNDLLKQAAVLGKRRQQKQWREASFARLEQSIMLGFYSIRKLIEAGKVSNEISGQAINITMFKATGKPVTRLNCHRIGELYKMHRPQRAKIKLAVICNQFIHSYVFMPSFDDSNRLESILFTSDFKRNKQLYCLAIEGIVSIFQGVGENYPSKLTYNWNSDTGDYDMRQE